MPYGKTKVYNDGSHYIAIPHTTNPTKRRIKPQEELIVVKVEKEESPKYKKVDSVFDAIVFEEDKEKAQENKPIKLATRSEIFNEVYKESLDLPKKQRKSYILNRMKTYFNKESTLMFFVEKKLEAKAKSLIARKTRFIRKAYLNKFNYFVTFTYDDKLQTAITFRKKLAMCLSTFQKRKSWRYMGVWERAPKTKRLHFHGLFYIPEGTMPGSLIDVKDYSLKTHKMQITKQNTYFNSRFGRSDFEEYVGVRNSANNTLAYIMKYIEKTEERIVYSRGIPMYIISDISDEDVVCRIGLEDKKLLLFDNFTAWDEGELIGTISPETKKRLRTSN